MSVDKNTHQATFKGGTTLNEVNIILEKHGLAMSQLGSISGQTVAGAIATGMSYSYFQGRKISLINKPQKVDFI